MGPLEVSTLPLSPKLINESEPQMKTETKGFESASRFEDLGKRQQWRMSFWGQLEVSTLLPDINKKAEVNHRMGDETKRFRNEMSKVEEGVDR